MKDEPPAPPQSLTDLERQPGIPPDKHRGLTPEDMSRVIVAYDSGLRRPGEPVGYMPVGSGKIQIGKRSSIVWIQAHLKLPPRRRGFHLITREVEAALPGLADVHVGLLHVFILHTSASLCLNENADPDVPRDLELAFDEIAREDFPYAHTLEGPDDMPAHVKAALIGSSVTVPIENGRLCLGTWQGIYLCEHRDRGGPRRLVLTVHGEGPPAGRPPPQPPP